VKCRHRKQQWHAWWPRAGGSWQTFVPEVDGEPGRKVCMRCGAWLPLGLANDADERVTLEIRAAELASTWNPNSGEWNGFESLGMVSPDAEHAPLIERDIAEGRDKCPRDLAAYYAGHLALCITQHPEGGE